MLILDVWGISFQPAVVVGLGNDFLFNSSVGHCVVITDISRKRDF